MKKFLRLLPVFALIGCLGLVGCGSNSPSSSDDGDNKSEAAQQDETQQEAVESDYQVKIGKCKVTKDYEGKACLLVTYTFTNNSDEKVSPAGACSFKAYQNGSELDEAYNGDWDFVGYSKDCKKGGKRKFQVGYKLDNKKSDVEIEAAEWLFSDKVIASKTVSTKK